MAKKFHLITRSDMDGLVYAVILKQLELIDDIKFVHPKDISRSPLYDLRSFSSNQIYLYM